MAYTLIGPDGISHASARSGTLGGHRRSKVFGRLDCPGALRWLARGHYAAHRVFFADAATAWAAGYRPCATCLPEEYRTWGAGRAAFCITPPPPYDADAVLAFLGARAVPGLEQVEGGAFHRTLGRFAVTLRAAGGAVDIEFAPRGGAPGDSAAGDSAAGGSAAGGSGFGEAARTVRRVLDADADPLPIAEALGGDALLGPLLRARPGLRCPGAFDAYEVAVRAIVGQAISVAAARTILGRLAERGLFPAREALAAARPEDLPMPRARAAALIALANGAPLDAIKGVGPWTRGYVALRSGDPDVLLHGDLIVRRSTERLGGPSSARALAELGERWSPFRSSVTHHLWAAA